jgi:hypothetical protein
MTLPFDCIMVSKRKCDSDSEARKKLWRYGSRWENKYSRCFTRWCVRSKSWPKIPLIFYFTVRLSFWSSL